MASHFLDCSENERVKERESESHVSLENRRDRQSERVRHSSTDSLSG